MISQRLVLIILALIFLSPTLSDLAADRAALLRLQSAVRGRTLLWNTTIPTPCSWAGVKCDETTNRVIALRLPGSGLRGVLPPGSVGSLSELRVLSLRRNSFSGEIPSDLSLCTQLQEVHLVGNMFSGEIPAAFFSLTNLQRVNLAGNNFSGNLSSGFNSLTQLRTLYLENNRFTGSLPDLNSLTELRNFNVSFNGLTGSIPSSLRRFPSQSFLGTSLSLGDSDNNLSGGAIAGIAVGSCVFLLLILAALYFSWRKYRSRKTKTILPRAEIPSPLPPSPVKPPEQETWNYSNPDPIVVADDENYYNLPNVSKFSGDGLVFFGLNVEAFSLRELMSAYAEVMGKGVVGSTYKAYFESGIEVIVKRLRNVSVSEDEFVDKIEEVGSFVHENLEPLRGYFYGREEKLLLFEPINNGSLSQLLHGNNKRHLSWEMRSKIALGTARGIEYLHSIGPKTSHGNIKSSNIFITDYYNARVSEFGLTQLVSPISNLNAYRAPEAIDSREISQKADVYSFGVLLLELITGKSPDTVLIQDGIELPNWVHSVGRESWSFEVLDSDLLRLEHCEEEMMQMLHLAVSCTVNYPDRRPSIVEVTLRIEDICG